MTAKRKPKQVAKPIQPVLRPPTSKELEAIAHALSGRSVAGRGEFVNVCAAPVGQAASRKPVSSGAPTKRRAPVAGISYRSRARAAHEGRPNSRYGHRDATLILVAFWHGLRAAEVCDLEWSQVEFGRSASLHV